MAYTTINKSSDYFNTKLYTGNGGTQSITGVGFQPDWVWNKNRSSATSHQLFDAVRGATKRIYSDSTAAEDTNTNSLTSFNSDGFSVGSGSSANGNGNNIVSWNWKAGTSLNNSAGSNNGSIASTGSFSTTSGFSIVKWSGSNSAGTVYTGLSGKIDFVILKNLSTTRNWIVKPKSFSANNVLYLQETNSTVSSPGDGWIGALTATNGTISLVAGGSGSNPLKNVNENGSDYIAYCFQEKTGYSKFGSYAGNGSTNGAFVYLGFKPAFVIFKKTSESGNNWRLFDNKRLGYNSSNSQLYPNLNNVEDTGTNLDILSNGFKVLTTSGDMNNNGETYIYMAFAEAPLVGTNNVPCTAR